MHTGAPGMEHVFSQCCLNKCSKNEPGSARVWPTVLALYSYVQSVFNEHLLCADRYAKLSRMLSHSIIITIPMRPAVWNRGTGRLANLCKATQLKKRQDLNPCSQLLCNTAFPYEKRHEHCCNHNGARKGVSAVIQERSDGGDGNSSSLRWSTAALLPSRLWK